jgi:hypothetical protein
MLLSGSALFVLLCFSVVVSVDAASMWSRTYEGGGVDCPSSLIATSDGGYAIAGYTTPSNGSYEDMNFWLFKTDALGNIQLNKTYGPGFAYSLIATSDGGYAIAGYKGNFWDRNFYLVKTDANGVLEWNKTYGETEGDVSSLIATSDGGYALVGTLYGDSPTFNDAWLVKTDATGNVEWNQTYGGTGIDYAESLVAAPDGGYTIVGSTNSSGAGNSDFWLVKTDALGNMQWNKTYGGTGREIVESSLVLAPDGGYTIGGYTESPHMQFNILLVKTDALGNMQWNKTYGEGGAHSVIATSDGGYAIIAGYRLIKTDMLGNMEWNQTYGESALSFPMSVVATSDGGYAITGNKRNDSLAQRRNIWLVKTDELGFVPEFSSLLVPALVLTATALIIINKKRLLLRRS